MLASLLWLTLLLGILLWLRGLLWHRLRSLLRSLLGNRLRWILLKCSKLNVLAKLITIYIYKFTLYSECSMEFHLFNRYCRNLLLLLRPLQFRYHLNLIAVEVIITIMDFILAIKVIKVIILAIIAKVIIVMDLFMK